MFEDMVYRYQISIELMIEVMVLSYIRMYEKEFPEKKRFGLKTKQQISNLYIFDVLSSNVHFIGITNEIEANTSKTLFIEISYNHFRLEGFCTTCT
jgi:hypothetical protein